MPIFLSIINSLLPFLNVLVYKASANDDEFSLFAIFLLINSSVLLADIGITASIFKYYSRLYSNSNAFIHPSGDDLYRYLVARKIARLVPLVAIPVLVYYFYYSVRLNLKLEFNFLFFIILPVSVFLKWKIAVLKTLLLSMGKSLVFWSVSLLFNASRLAAICINITVNGEVFDLLFLFVVSYLLESYSLSVLHEYFKPSKEDGVKFEHVRIYGFEFKLGLSSLLWSFLLQIDKLTIGLILPSKELGDLIYFLNLASIVFIFSSAVYSSYGSKYFLSKELSFRAFNRSLTFVFCFFFIALCSILNIDIFYTFLDIINVDRFYYFASLSYLVIMVCQPIIPLLVSEGNYNQISLIMFASLAGFLVGLLVNINFAWFLQSFSFIGLSLFFLRALDLLLFKVFLIKIFYLIVSLFLFQMLFIILNLIFQPLGSLGLLFAFVFLIFLFIFIYFKYFDEKLNYAKYFNS